MSPGEIKALFADASAKFAPILGNPNDDDLTALHEILMPLLLSIPYGKDGAAPLHNLIGIIKLLAMYLATWHGTFPVPARPACYDAGRPNTTSDSPTMPPMKQLNAPL